MGMRLRPALLQSVARLLLVTGLAGGLAACSSDTMRFGDNPFSNPFASSDAKDTSSTASIQKPGSAMAAPSTAVTSQALPPVGQVSSSSLPPVSAAPAVRTAAVAPSAIPAVTPPLGTAKGWTSQGGSNVSVGQGETIKSLANRYGVPEQAIRAANGLAATAQPAPGSQLVIPVYNAADAANSAAAPVKAAVASAPAKATAAATKTASTAVGQGRMQLVKGAEPAATAAAKAAAVAKPATQVAKVEPTKLAATKIEPVKAEAKTAATAAVAAAAVPVTKKGTEAAKAADTAVKTAKVEAAEPAKAAAKAAAAPAAEETTASIAASAKSSATEFRWPAKGRVISGFGSKGGASNDGINISLPEGTPVKAAEGGVVAYAGNELKGYGNLVLIRHPDGWVSAYAHNGDIKVKRGDTVARGQTVAVSGQSGNVSSPQLHFELRKGSTPVDPMPHLSAN